MIPRQKLSMLMKLPLLWCRPARAVADPAALPTIRRMAGVAAAEGDTAADTFAGWFRAAPDDAAASSRFAVGVISAVFHGVVGKNLISPVALGRRWRAVYQRRFCSLASGSKIAAATGSPSVECGRPKISLLMSKLCTMSRRRRDAGFAWQVLAKLRQVYPEPVFICESLNTRCVSSARAANSRAYLYVPALGVEYATTSHLLMRHSP